MGSQLPFDLRLIQFWNMIIYLLTINNVSYAFEMHIMKGIKYKVFV